MHTQTYPPTGHHAYPIQAAQVYQYHSHFEAQVSYDTQTQQAGVEPTYIPVNMFFQYPI